MQAELLSLTALTIALLEGTDASDGNWDQKSAEQLQKIAETLSRVTDFSTQSIKIVVAKQN